MAMTKKEFIKAVRLIEQMDKINVRVGRLRDEMREKFHEFEEVMSDVDDATDEFNSAIRGMESALDILSRNL